MGLITMLTTVQSITRPCVTFHIRFHDKELLAPCPRPKTEHNPTPTSGNWEISTFTATLGIWKFLWARYNTWQGPHWTQHGTSHIKILRTTPQTSPCGICGGHSSIWKCSPPGMLVFSTPVLQS